MRRIEPSRSSTDWSKNGSLATKPEHGWLHPSDSICGAGITYQLRYVGCITVRQSMRSLPFASRTQLAREAIASVYDASKHPNAPPLHGINLRFTGLVVNLTISTSALVLTSFPSQEKIAEHQMHTISFASGGDQSTSHLVGYIAKDPVNDRACHVLECSTGLASDVITTIGQAFELRYKQYLETPTITPVNAADRGKGLSVWSDIDEKKAAEPERAKDLIDLETPSNYPEIQSSMVSSTVKAEPENGQPRWDDSIYNDPYTKSNLPPPLDKQTNPAAFVPPHLPPKNRSESPALDEFNMAPFNSHPPSHLNPVNHPPVSSSPPPPPLPTQPIPHRNSPLLISTISDDNLRQEAWFHGPLTRQESEQLLKHDGDFLVRESTSSTGQYVLSGMQNSIAKHLLLVDPEGKVRTRDQVFNSVSHLISYHVTNNLPIVSSGSVVRLKQPVVNPRIRCSDI